MLRYLTAGESHGPGLTVIIEGLPAGLKIDREFINKRLAMRQGGYGRGGRMKIEKDQVEFLSGIRHGETIGSPVTLFIKNLDHDNWGEIMSPDKPTKEFGAVVSSPRPGHADLAGGQKYLRKDFRDILERSSARETAAKTAAGAVAELLLGNFGISCYFHVVSISTVSVGVVDLSDLSFETEFEPDGLYCLDKKAEQKMIDLIDKARKEGDTLGGVFEIIIAGVPVGLGSHVSADRRLDARLAAALMGVPAIKAVEVGLGLEAARLKGSEVHDELFYDRGKVVRKTNRAGGVEGGISNGEPVVLRAAMKPIPTLMTPLKSFDIQSKQTTDAAKERSDVCAVPAAGVVGRAVAAFEIAKSLLEKTGGDSIEESKANYSNFIKSQQQYLN